jgi:hypothetical protein
VMMIVGTRDGQNRPDIGRGVGCRVLPGRDRIEVLVSGWQWAGTVANIRETEEAAFTFVRPADYRAYQVKGRASLRDCTPEDITLCERYIATVTAALAEQGVPDAMTAAWLTPRDIVAATVEISGVSIKTPGHQAGMVIGAAR